MGKINWRPVTTELYGLLGIARHAPRSQHGQADVIFARTFLEAPDSEIRKFSFGFSDMANIFLDGQLLYSGNNAYHSRSENLAGIINLQDTIHLPLVKGRNEIMFQVIETFGDSGLMGQDNSDDFHHTSLHRQWQLSTECRIPESALYDPQRDVIYVTNYFRGGNEFISKISCSGEVETPEWITGLTRPTGMVLWNNRLWVIDRNGLIGIDIAKGELLEEYLVPNPSFLNDVAFDASGNGYVSDRNLRAERRFVS